MPVPIIQDVIDFCHGSDLKTVRQYGSNLEKTCDMIARQRRHDLRQEPACPEGYRRWVPKFDPRSAPLLERIAREGWSHKTYKQYAEDGRRAIESFSGALQARQERRVRRDAWHGLLTDAQELAEAGLVPASRMKSLRKLVDIARQRDIDLPDVSREVLISWHGNLPRQFWERVVKGAEALDKLRPLDTLSHHLPVTPLSLSTLELRAVHDVPDGLVAEVAEWVRVATTMTPQGVNTADGKAVLETRLSKGAIGVFAAAMSCFLSTLAKRKTITQVNTIRGLFSETDIEHVLVDWISAHKEGKPSALSPRTMYRYADCLKLALSRNGHAEPAEMIAVRCSSYPILIEGREANEYMAAETEAWCRELIGNPQKIAVFETQHVAYKRQAEEALLAANAEGLDLVALADPSTMKKLPQKQRSTAKRLLREARVFGVCAAYAAIALEGAPFRKSNILGLIHKGARQTFFDNRSRQEGFSIEIPNEELKNGDALTRRNQRIPPIPICGNAPGSFGEEILTFYLARIRLLFPNAAKSPYLFPSVVANGLGMVDKTFDNWLLKASEAVGFPLTSHNFRHGYCSIEIKEDPNCIEDLAVVLGDLPSTIANYYAFVDKIAVLRRHQDHRSKRRAAYRLPTAGSSGVAA
ncbi:MAG: hypothetical protein HUJ24_11180 [Rhodobacteraceae bacterium]|nr:hypothetical protein [Paracoccaceae bacterium]